MLSTTPVRDYQLLSTTPMRDHQFMVIWVKFNVDACLERRVELWSLSARNVAKSGSDQQSPIL